MGEMVGQRLATAAEMEEYNYGKETRDADLKKKKWDSTTGLTLAEEQARAQIDSNRADIPYKSALGVQATANAEESRARAKLYGAQAAGGGPPPKRNAGAERLDYDMQVREQSLAAELASMAEHFGQQDPAAQQRIEAELDKASSIPDIAQRIARMEAVKQGLPVKQKAQMGIINSMIK
jgi:hypothetical protein